MPRERTLSCSFCGKTQHEVARLIAGPKVYICETCVETCIEILGEDHTWCDGQIARLKRLRTQPKPERPAQEQAQPESWGSRWIGRLLR